MIGLIDLIFEIFGYLILFPLWYFGVYILISLYHKDKSSKIKKKAALNISILLTVITAVLDLLKLL